MAFRSWVGVLLSALLLPPLLARIRAEERLLRTQFGDEYDAYCARTSRLVPALYWRCKGTHKILSIAPQSKLTPAPSADHRISWLNSASKEQGKLGEAMKQILSDISPVLTVKDLAHYLRVHPSTVYRLLKDGQLPAFKVGSDWRFNLEEIDRWRVEHEKEPDI